MQAVKKLISVDFEVFGKVQGVWFRKYTHIEATRLNLVGWCMNTPQGTVRGIMQGEVENVEQMRVWLKQKGSPLSKIEKAEFLNERDISSLEFTEFSIHRD